MLSHALTIGIMPVLTRLYSPSEFGVWALYMSVLAVLMVLGGFHYDQMITQAESEEDAEQLVLLVVVISLLASLLLLVICALARTRIASALGDAELAAWLWFIPLSVLLHGAYMALRYYSVRHKEFSLVSQGMICRASGSAGFSSVVGFVASGVLHKGGLVLGQVLGDFFNCAWLAKRHHRALRQRAGKISVSGLRHVAVQHKNQAAALAGSAMVGKITERLPHFMAMAAYGTATLGYLGVAERIVFAPISLLSLAISDVFRQRASQLHLAGQSFEPLAVKTAKLTAAAAAIPYALGIMLAEPFFAWLLGSEWREVGKFAEILLVGGYLSFVLNPFDVGLVILKANRCIILIDVLRFLLKMLLLVIVVYGGVQVYTMLWGLVAVQSLVYILTFFFVIYYLRLRFPEVDTESGVETGSETGSGVVSESATGSITTGTSGDK